MASASAGKLTSWLNVPHWIRGVGRRAVNGIIVFIG